MRVGFYKKKSTASKTAKALNKKVKGSRYTVSKVKGGYGLYKRRK